MNCSSTCLFHRAQSFRKRLFHRPTAPARKAAPAWAPLYRLQFLTEVCSSMGSPQAAASFRASPPALQWVLHGLQCGYLFQHGLPWAAASSCFTMVFSKGCRGISDPMTGAPLPSSFSDLAVLQGCFPLPTVLHPLPTTAELLFLLKDIIKKAK